jgi:hypothetical protein
VFTLCRGAGHPWIKQVDYPVREQGSLAPLWLRLQALARHGSVCGWVVATGVVAVGFATGPSVTLGRQMGNSAGLVGFGHQLGGRTHAGLPHRWVGHPESLQPRRSRGVLARLLSQG